MAYDDTLRHAPATSDDITIRRITVRDLGRALGQGYEDFNARPSFGAFLLLIYPLAVLLFVLFLQDGNLLYLAFPMLAGLTLLGPAVSVALFEMSRRREAGLESSWRAAFGWVRSASFAPILGLSLIMMLLYGGWLALAEALYFGTVGAPPPESLADFAARLTGSREGAALILYGNVCGLLFAVAALAMSVVAFPLLLDRPVSLLTAVGTSIRAVASNLGVMLLWGLLVTVLLAAGAALLLVGLAAVLPILGHATWHLYRRLVEAPPQPVSPAPQWA